DDGYGVEVTAGGVDTLSTYPAGGATVASLMADGAGFAASAMENSGTASGSTYFMGLGTSTDSGANGKICVIDRGEISFQDKVANCENSGGLGAVIINNEPGMLYGTLGSPNNTSIPAVGAANEDRSAIVAASSASVSVSSGDYGMMSGTSMATPAAAGAAALIWSNHPTCTGTQIRDAMKATAEDQGAAGRDDYFGYGIVKAKAASDYLTANGCGGGTPNVAPTASFTFSCSALSCDFDGSGSSDSDGSVVSYSWNFGDGNSASGATASHTYAGNGTYEVTLTVTDNAGATGSSNQDVSVNDGGGTGGDYTLSVNSYKVKGVQHADLSWSGNSGNVDIYRDGNAVASNVGGSSYTDNIGSKGGGVYVYQVCNAGTNTCSNSVNAVF
ncbi:MAG: PKD domain-containing protein, partial [Gammaproteobacteria bacterium]